MTERMTRIGFNQITQVQVKADPFLLMISYGSKTCKLIFPKAVWKGKPVQLQCYRSLRLVRQAHLSHPSMSSRAFSHCCPSITRRR